MLPLQPSGLRFLHFILFGLFLGVALPVGLLFAKVYLDPRVRIGKMISDRHKIPLLTVVPHLWSPSEALSVRREVGWLSLAVSGILLVIVITGALRFIKII